VDSTCDLPPDWIDDRQIHVIPCLVTFGEQVFLDRVTISADQVYALLENKKIQPKTSQPTLKSVQSTLSYLAGHYESVIVLTISDKLTGVYRTCQKTAETLAGKKITVIDSRNAAAGLGLQAARASEMILAGRSHEDVVKALESWIPKTKIYVDVQTMKYLVRSGRVGRVKGGLARALNIKPVLTLTEEGRIESVGQSFHRAGNMARIIRKIETEARERRVWGYALVHVRNLERVAAYAGKLTALFGRPPAFMMEVSPAIGIHCGIGSVGVAVLYE
ncbi:MAG: DegV family protein, partial [Candidatus Aminicenantes bacterium]|nr:DegV family protein [Candidatus Aminicenantes bacterium]